MKIAINKKTKEREEVQEGKEYSIDDYAFIDICGGGATNNEDIEESKELLSKYFNDRILPPLDANIGIELASLKPIKNTIDIIEEFQEELIKEMRPYIEANKLTESVMSEILKKAWDKFVK